jgi:phage host-nuclease inhibitor protein Gam
MAEETFESKAQFYLKLLNSMSRYIITAYDIKILKQIHDKEIETLRFKTNCLDKSYERQKELNKQISELQAELKLKKLNNNTYCCKCNGEDLASVGEMVLY